VSERTALLGASLIEAFFLLMLMGYGPLYVHQYFGASDFLASQAAALPALATFFGSTLWGQVARRLNLTWVASVGVAGYGVMGIAIRLVTSPTAFVVLVGCLALFSSALRPSVVASLTQVPDGRVGERLALRIRWQSVGWLVGGLFGGYVYGLGRGGYPTLMLVLGLMAATTLGVLVPYARRAHAVDRRTPRTLTRFRLPWPLLLAIVLPFFLSYVGSEGFFTNFGLYLGAIHVAASWVGWSTAISTALGFVMVPRLGRLADKIGGRRMLVGMLLLSLVVFSALALFHQPILTVALFSLPLYAPVTMSVQLAMAEALPSHHHGAAMGVINGLGGLATFLGGSLVGALESSVSPTIAPTVVAILMALALGLSAASLGPHRLRPHRPADA